MATLVKAIYRQGVLELVEPVAGLRENQEVYVQVAPVGGEQTGDVAHYNQVAPFPDRSTCTDKAALTCWFEQFMATQDIQREPVGAIVLQQRIAATSPLSNEFSQEIIAMREE